MRRLRYIPPPGLTVEVTARTVQSRLLLRPSKETNDLILGVLGRALERHPRIALHAFVFLSNHFHLILTTPDARELANFMCFLQGNIAREVGRAIGWREKFWGRRYVDVAILDDEALLDRLAYLFSQGCKENLVASPLDWPGASSVLSMVDGTRLRGNWFDRTKEYEARRRGEKPHKHEFATVYEIALAPISCWKDLPERERRRRCSTIVAKIESETRARTQETRRPVAGAAWVRAQDPQGTPKHSSHSPAPICHAADRDRWLFYRSAYENFVELYRNLSQQIRNGALSALENLPRFCFPPPLPWRGCLPSRTALATA